MKPVTLKLDNPLVIDSDAAWTHLLGDKGVQVLSGASKEFYSTPERIPEGTKKLQRLLKADGYDGVIVKNTDTEKRLRETFGHDQAVKFNGEEVYGSPDKPVNTSRSMPMRLEAPEGDVELTTTKEIMKAIQSATTEFGSSVPIRIGRIAQKALGIYKVTPEVIRLETADDIPVATHEVAHAVEKIVFRAEQGNPWNSKRASRKMREELVGLGKNLYGEKVPQGGYKGEGFAEFVRLYMTNRSEAQKKAPEFYKWFTKAFLPQHTKGAAQIEKASRLIMKWQAMGSTNRGRQGMVDTGTIAARVDRLKRRTKQALATETLIEKFSPLREYTELAESILGRKLKPSEDPYRIAKGRRMRHHGIIRQFVERVVTDPTGTPVNVKPLDDIRALVHLNESTDFAIYLWAKRAVAMLTDPNGKRNPRLSLEDAQQIIEDLGNNRFQLASAMVYDWQNAVLDYVAQSSPLFEQVVRDIKKRDPGNYVPLSRVFDSLDREYASTSSGSSAAKGNISGRLKGSGRAIKSIFPQIIANSSNMLRIAHERQVMDAVLKVHQTVPGMGNLIEEVPRNQLPAGSITLESMYNKLQSSLEKDGIGVDLTDAQSGEQIDVDELGLDEETLTLFMPAQQPSGSDPIVPMKNQDGELKFYYVPSNLYNTLSGMDLPTLHAMALPLTWSAKAFRAGTTGLRASFGLITNPLRDVQTYALNSQSDTNVKMFSNYFTSLASAAKYAITGKSDSDALNFFLRTAGEMSQQLGIDYAPTRRLARRVFEGRAVRSFDPRNWFDFYRDLVQFPESAPRVAEIANLAEKHNIDLNNPTMDEMLTLVLGSAEVTVDFAAAGTFFEVMRQVVPFSNVSVQGPRANLRSFRRNPTKFLLRGAALSALSLAMWWSYKDEEWWKTMPYRERYSSWWIPFTNPSNDSKELLRVPIGYEANQVFSGLPVAMADAWHQDDPKAASEFLELAFESNTPDYLPVPLREAKEQLQNRDDYFQTPIVPPQLEHKPAEEQYTEYTSRASRFIGKQLGWSPSRIDHAIPGIAGPVSRDILNLLGLGAPHDKGESQLSDTPVLGKLFRTGGQSGRRSLPVSNLYERFHESRIAANSDENPETPQDREIRLIITDATKAVSALLKLRRASKSESRRRKLSNEATAIAKEALAQLDRGNRSRGRMKRRRKEAERQLDRHAREIR